MVNSAAANNIKPTQITEIAHTRKSESHRGVRHYWTVQYCLRFKNFTTELNVGNCSPTPPLRQHYFLLLTLGKMLA